MRLVESIAARLGRRKALAGVDTASSQLKRCLTTVDLTLLGIGSTLGVGVYVLAGGVARETAGPSVVLSFVIAGVASALSGLCYAEFGARVPRAGSAYIYSYVTIGELAAFVIGWNLLLEYIIGTASVARGYSGYLDSLLNNTMKNTFQAAMPMHVPFLAEYPDWTAFAITLVLTCVLSVGVQESTRFNNLFTLLNLGVVGLVVGLGLSEASLANWSLDVSAADQKARGAGGFFPFGLSGTLSGAATCFYGFVGFDAIATTGEETRNPQRSIPIAIVISLAVVCVAYVGVSSVLTLMVPYYLQDVSAPLPFVFHEVGLMSAGWVVAVGALFGLSTSLLGAMFPLPRVVYAMASDGLLPRFLGSVHYYFHTPLIATLVSGVLAAVMALVFDLGQLVDMMSIGTLMAYTMVGLSVLLLRYRPCSSQLGPSYTALAMQDHSDSEEELFPIASSTHKLVYTWREYARQMLNLDRATRPTALSSHVAAHSAVVFSLLAIPFSLLIMGTAWHHKVGAALTGLKMLICLIAMARQPTDTTGLSFTVPLVPWLPSASILTNVFLTTKLSPQTWVRFAVWMVGGLLIYGLYGWRNSSEEYLMLGQVPPDQETTCSTTTRNKEEILATKDLK